MEVGAATEADMAATEEVDMVVDTAEVDTAAMDEEEDTEVDGRSSGDGLAQTAFAQVLFRDDGG
jgi:hypothetical protein